MYTTIGTYYSFYMTVLLVPTEIYPKHVEIDEKYTKNKL